MAQTTHKIAGIAGSAIMVTSMMATAATASAQQVDSIQAEFVPAAAEAGARQVTTAVHQQQAVEGTFSFTQTAVSSNEEIARAMGDAPQYLCGAAGQVVTPNKMVGSISVTGDVANAFTATTAELIDRATETLVLGCSCAGNPADGRSSVNALVTGIPLATLLADAQLAEGANTVVFTSADGYEVALPLYYVMQRYCPIVFDVNGSPLVETVGGTNQLWLGSTSARYFARDIVSIDVQTRPQAEIPAKPGSAEAGDTYANLPNVGVFFGGNVR